VAISVVPGRATVDDIQPPPSQRPDQSRCHPPHWRWPHSSQPRPSAAEPKPSRQGPRVPVRSRLGPAVTCVAPPAVDLQEADPSCRGSLASPIPQAHASVPEAACIRSTVHCEAACIRSTVHCEATVAGDPPVPSAVTSCLCPPLSGQRRWEQQGPPAGQQKPAPKKDEGCPQFAAHLSSSKATSTDLEQAAQASLTLFEDSPHAITTASVQQP
jgi:hypothetical protein